MVKMKQILKSLRNKLLIAFIASVALNYFYKSSLSITNELIRVNSREISIPTSDRLIEERKNLVLMEILK